MNDINGNVLEMLSAREIIADNNTVSYLNVRNLPYKEMIIMSATVNPELYRMMIPDRKIQVYKCKEAEYMGKIIQYTDQTYSRGSIKRNTDISEKLKEKYNGCNVITFAEFEQILVLNTISEELRDWTFSKDRIFVLSELRISVMWFISCTQ